MHKKRIVITGLGALTPIGNDLQSYWKSLINGVSGANLITHFDPSNFKTKFACELKNYDQYAAKFIDSKQKRRLDLCAQYGLIAASQALADSGLKNSSSKERESIGVIWGTGIGGLLSFEEEVMKYAQEDKNPRFSPFFISKMMANAIPAEISIKFEFKGPSYTTVSACTSAANAIADAYYLISLGKANVVVSGGSEAAITQSGVGGFNALKGLSTRNEDYKTASRPFDRERDGFVLGEGAACLILEEYEHAMARGAKIYAEIDGIGMSSDAYHTTAPHPEGEGVISAMNGAFEGASISPSEVGHINTHGTSTKLGDIAELKSIEEYFKNQKGVDLSKIYINSTKSMTGHLLGAAGAIEAVATILALREGIIPPTINCFVRDEEIPKSLNLVLNKAIKEPIQAAMSNTFGFGGHNVSILFKKL